MLSHAVGFGHHLVELGRESREFLLKRLACERLIAAIDDASFDQPHEVDVETAGRPAIAGNVSLKEAEKIPPVNKVEKPLPVDENNKLTGLTVPEIKPRWKIDVVAGNVATREGCADRLVPCPDLFFGFDTTGGWASWPVTFTW